MLKRKKIFFHVNEYLLINEYLNGPSPAFKVKTVSPGLAFSATSSVYTAFAKSGTASFVSATVTQSLAVELKLGFPRSYAIIVML